MEDIEEDVECTEDDEIDFVVAVVGVVVDSGDEGPKDAAQYDEKIASVIVGFAVRLKSEDLAGSDAAIPAVVTGTSALIPHRVNLHSKS